MALGVAKPRAQGHEITSTAMAIEIAKEQENKNIVIIIPDRGDRYYSMNL